MPKAETETGVWKTISSKSIELAEIPTGIESEGDVEGGTNVVNSYRSDEGFFWLGQLQYGLPTWQLGSRTCSLCNNK